MSIFSRLLGFEIKKHFLSPWLLLFLAALLLLNGWQLSREYKEATKATANCEALYVEFYARWKGPITAEKVADLMTIYGPLKAKSDMQVLSRLPGSGTYLDTEEEDYRFFSKQFAEEMEYDYLYVNRAAEICTNAKALADAYAQKGNRFVAAKNKAMMEAFTGRSISDFSDTRYIEVWFSYDFSSLLVLLLCLLGLGPMFVSEREAGMYMLQRTARHGGSTTVAAKLTAATGYMLLLCGLFYAEDFLVLQVLSGHAEALRSPVYAIPLLRTTRLNMTIGQFVLWLSSLKTLGILACGWLILLLSCLCRRVLGAYLGSIGAMIALILLQEFALARPWLKLWNPVELLLSRELVWNASYVDFFGFPVPLDCFVLAGNCFVLMVLFGAVLLCNPGRRPRR